MRAISAAVATLALLAPATLVPATAAPPDGMMITNGTVQLGVNGEGHLIYDCTGEPGCPEPSFDGAEEVGVRYVPFNYDGLSPGAPAEGWGAADEDSGLVGTANMDDSPETMNITQNAFVATSSTAVSTVTVSDGSLPGHALQVVHDYHPLGSTPNLFEGTVTLRNTGTAPLNDVRYRRVLDWDVEPTPFEEWVTILNATKAANVLFSSDEGFASTSPLDGPEYDQSEAVCGPGYTGPCDFTDLGDGGTYPTVQDPDDHGAMFDLGFGALPPGASLSFRIFYGAAEGTATAMDALGLAGVEVASLGESNCPEFEENGGLRGAQGRSAAEGAQPPANCVNQPPNAGVERGLPVTFIFGLADVGGQPIRCPEFPTEPGDPHIVGTDKGEALVGTKGDDIICGLGGNDTIRGLHGSDKIAGGTGNDTIRAGHGNDEVLGGAGRDTIRGQPGGDLLKGQGGKDRIFGGRGKDRINGGKGKDRCKGGKGKDKVRACER